MPWKFASPSACIAKITSETRFHNMPHTTAGFVPRETINVVATKDIIHAAMQEDHSLDDLKEPGKQELAKHVALNCPKLFVMCMVQGIDLSFFWEHTNSTLFTDVDLPLNHNTPVDSKFRALVIGRLIPYQQTVLSPFLHEGTFDTSIMSSSILPVKTERQIARGASSTVSSVTLFNGLFSFASADNTHKIGRWSRNFAMKHIHDDVPTQREEEFLQALHDAKIRHENIQLSYCGFRFEGELHLISEIATTDLQKLFITSEPDAYNVDDTWFRAQIYGLAEALALIDDIEPGVKTACLNDIKPANILVFGDNQPVLKFTDWGCAKISLAGQDSDGAIVYGDRSYWPPECSAKLPTTRAYDIWSLGCVYLELLVWYTKGKAAHREFFMARCGNEVDGDDAFQEYGVIKDSVLNRLDILEADEGGWRDVVGVVRDMLTVEPEERLTAEEVKQRLRLAEGNRAGEAQPHPGRAHVQQGPCNRNFPVR